MADWTPGPLGQPYTVAAPPWSNMVTPDQSTGIDVPAGVPIRITATGTLTFTVNSRSQQVFSLCVRSVARAQQSGLRGLGQSNCFGRGLGLSTRSARQAKCCSGRYGHFYGPGFLVNELCCHGLLVVDLGHNDKQFNVRQQLLSPKHMQSPSPRERARVYRLGVGGRHESDGSQPGGHDLSSPIQSRCGTRIDDRSAVCDVHSERNAVSAILHRGLDLDSGQRHRRNRT